MNTTYDSSHAKNVASLQKLIQLYTDIGAAYSPVPADIKITGLNSLFTNADAALTTVKNTYNDWKNATNSRDIAFKVLPGLSTQLLGLLESSGPVQQTVDDFISLANKMRGEGSRLIKSKAAKKAVDPETSTIPPTEPPAEVKEPVTHSTSQRSFDNMIEHFDKMIKLLISVPAYNPSETQFKVATLTTQLATLKTLNNTANDAYYKWSLARINRNKIFYGDITGMLDIVRKSKSYIKGKFGAGSQEYKAALNIKFYRVIPKKKAK